LTPPEPSERPILSCPYGPDRTLSEGDEIDLLDLARVIRKRLRFLFSFVLICCAAALIFLFTAEDVYQAKATIMPVQGRKTINIPFFQELKELDEIKNMLSANLPAAFQDHNTTTIRAVLQSRSFNIYLVEKYQLLPKLFAKYWYKDKQGWLGDERRGLYSRTSVMERFFGKQRNFKKYAPTSIDGAELLMEKFLVDKSRPQKDWLELRFEDKDPAFAAAMLNRYIAELDYYLRNQEIDRAEANQKYLQELIKTQKNEEIRQGLNRVIVSQIEAAMYARVASDFAFKTIDPPLIPPEAYKPKRPQILLLTLVISLFCGIFGIFFLECLSKTKKRWQQVQQQTDTSGTQTLP